MSTEIGSLHYTLDLDDKGLHAKLDNTDSRLEKVGHKLLTAGKLLATGFSIAGAAAAGLGAAGIKSAGQFEQSRVAFETMLGSADKARQMMQDIAKFAKETPFELPQVVSGTKQLLAFGFAQEQLLPTMRKLGDLASGLGVPIEQLTTVFGQVRVAGRLMGQDLLQFTNAGVPLIEALAVTMKKPQGEIKKLVEQGKVGFPEVETALNHLTGEGSKFGGMMEKQSKTFSGVVSNIKDGFGQLLRSAVGMTAAGDIIEGGFFDRIKNAALTVMPLIQQAADRIGPAMQAIMEKVDQFIPKIVNLATQIGDYLWPKFEALWNTITTNVIPVLSRLWHEVIEPFIPVIGTLLVGAIGLAVDIVNALFNAITPVVNFLIENKEFLTPIILAFGALKAAMMLGAAFDAIKVGFATMQLVQIPSLMATLGALKGAFIAAFPMAAVVATVVTAFNMIQDKARETERVLNETNRNIEKSTESSVAAIKRLGELKRTGTPEQQARATKALDAMLMGRAMGGPVMAGMPYVTGEQGRELFIPSRNGTIIPHKETEAIMRKGGDTIFNIGQINNAQDEDYVLRRLDRNQLLEGMGISPVLP